MLNHFVGKIGAHPVALSKCARRSRRAQALCNSENSASLMPGRAIHTISQPGAITSHTERTASLIRRRARLRTTALPIRRLTLNPQRLAVS